MIEPQFVSEYGLIKLKDPEAVPAWPDGKTNEEGEPLISGKPFRRDLTKLYIAHDGHFIGWRKWLGGRCVSWLRPGSFEEELFDYRQLVMMHEDAIYACLCVFGEPEMLVRYGEKREDASLDVPSPWDKYKIGAERLPEFHFAEKVA